MAKNSTLLKWLASAIGQTFVGVGALQFGGWLVAIIGSFILSIFAYDSSRSWWLTLLVALLSLYASISAVNKISLIALRHKKAGRAKDESGQSPQQMTQTGVSVNNTPIFAPVFNLGQREEQPIKEASPPDRPEKEVAPEASPNLRCTVARMARVSMLAGMAQEDSEGRDAAIVEFYNDPEAAFPVVPVSVRASITYEELEGTHRHPVPDGIWIGWVKNHMPFRLSDSRRLVIAIREDGITATFEHRIRKHPNLTWVDMLLARYTPLTGSAYRVVVQLIGDNPQKLCGKYEFKLTIKPEFNIQEINFNEEQASSASPPRNPAKRQYAIETLKELIKEEYRVNSTEWKDLTMAMTAPMVHSERVKRFLTDYVDYFGNDAFSLYQEMRVVALEQLLRELLEQ